MASGASTVCFLPSVQTANSIDNMSKVIFPDVRAKFSGVLDRLPTTDQVHRVSQTVFRSRPHPRELDAYATPGPKPASDSVRRRTYNAFDEDIAQE